MKKGVFLSVAVLLTAIFVFSLTGCKDNIKGNLLAAPAESSAFGYADAKDEARRSVTPTQKTKALSR